MKDNHVTIIKEKTKNKETKKQQKKLVNTRFGG